MVIQLVPFTESDIPQLIQWVDKPGSTDLWASRTYAFPLSDETVRTHLQKTKFRPFALLVFKIVDTDTHKTLGHIEIDRFDHTARSARITRFFIAPENRGQGIAYRALKLLQEMCFQELQLNRVEIMAMELNITALGVYERAGFKREGLLRENVFLKDQKYSSHLLSMLKSEYIPFDLQPILQGSLLTLRPLKRADFEELYAVASDPLIWELHPQKNRYQREVFQVFFDQAMASGGAFAILDQKTKKMIGSTRYYNFNAEKREIIAGYTFLSRAYWGGQYNREMKKLILNHAFQFVDGVIFEVGELNLRSRRAMEKIGGQLVATRTLDDKSHCIYRIEKGAVL